MTDGVATFWHLSEWESGKIYLIKIKQKTLAGVTVFDLSF